MHHVEHLSRVFERLRNHKLYAKMSTCSFGMKLVEHLGHIIFVQKVAIDPSKVEVMISWPRPTTLKKKRGFLDLIGYYRKFIHNYGVINKLLID